MLIEILTVMNFKNLNSSVDTNDVLFCDEQ